MLKKLNIFTSIFSLILLIHSEIKTSFEVCLLVDIFPLESESVDLLFFGSGSRKTKCCLTLSYFLKFNPTILLKFNPTIFINAVFAIDNVNKIFFQGLTFFRMCIKTAGGEYITSKKNGGFAAESEDAEMASRWEY